MSDLYWGTAAAAVFAMLFSASVTTEERSPEHGDREHPTEVCEAFPWDVPIEQSLMEDVVVRRGGHMQGLQRQWMPRPRKW